MDGPVVWQKNLVSEFGAPIPMWGFSGSPLILEDKLIIFAGGPEKKGLLALECAAGNTLWGFPSTDMNYTTARPMTLCGQSVVVFCDGKGAHAIDSKDGSAVWTFKPELWKGPAMVDPQQIGPESPLVGLGDGVGTARLEVSKTDDPWTVTEAWSSTRCVKRCQEPFIRNLLEKVPDHSLLMPHFAELEGANNKSTSKRESVTSNIFEDNDIICRAWSLPEI